MPEYRAYVIGHDGRIQLRIDPICDDEAEAVAQARQLVDGHDVELWEGSRKVTHFFHGE